MKKIFLYAMAVIFTLASCKKMLDQGPLDKLTPQQAFSAESNLELYTNSFIRFMVPEGGAIFKGDALADITVPNGVDQYLTPQYTAQQAGGWGLTAWEQLRNVNYFIVNNNNPAIAVSVRNHYTGIARFFRAWFYYDKVKTFGDVPWYNKPLDPNDPDLFKGRDPRTLVMDSVLADLNFAVTNINDTKDNSSSRITRSVALALKSRICLFEGTFRKYHTQLNLSSTANLWLTEAANAAKTLIDGGKYTLYTAGATPYRALFTSEAPISTEVILAQVYNNNLSRWHDANYWFTSPTYGLRLSLDKKFVDTYLNIDGTAFTSLPGYTTIQFQNEVKNRDGRLFQTIRTAPYKRSDGSAAPPDFTYTTTGYHINKFTLDDKTLDNRSPVANFNSIPIIRYAEILLNYAEARAELGQLSATDWTNTIGALRNRAGITNVNIPALVDPYLKANFYTDVNDPALMEIRRERGVELAIEGFRYDDLLRWKAGKLLEKPYTGIYVPSKGQVLDLNEDGQGDVAFVDVVPAVKVPGVVYVVTNGTSIKLSNGNQGNLIWMQNVTKEFPLKKYFRPIPISEIVLNPNLAQTGGW
ncbi:RagB/SusD family nutrient uptake outer membrane protein [Pedobacter sp.]